MLGPKNLTTDQLLGLSTYSGVRWQLDTATGLADSALRTLAKEREIDLSGVAIVVTLDVESPNLFHIQRIGCGDVVIGLAADYVLPMFDPTTPPSKRDERARIFKRRALTAIRFAAKFRKTNPLITSDLARAICEERKELRRVPVLTSLDYSLPDRYFTVTVDVTVRCQMSGRTLTQSASASKAKDVEARLKNKLSRELLVDQEASALIEQLEAEREYRSAPTQIQEVTLKSEQNGEQAIIKYDEKTSREL